MSTVLFAPDVPYAHSRAGAAWVVHMSTSLVELGHDVVFHPRERGVELVHEELRTAGISVAPYAAKEGEEDDTGHMARFRARSVIALAQQLKPEFVLSQGFDLCRYLARSEKLSWPLWTILSDTPFRSDPLPQALQQWLPGIISGSQRMLVASEAERAWLEARDPAATSKVSLLPLPPAGDDTPPAPADVPGSRPLYIDLDLFRTTSLPDLDPYIDVAVESRHVPAVIVAGSSRSPLMDSALWARIPGVMRTDSDVAPAGALGLVPGTKDPVAAAWAVAMFSAQGLTPIVCGDDAAAQGAASCANAADLFALCLSGRDDLGEDLHTPDPLRGRIREVPWFPSAHQQPRLWEGQDRPLRIVLAGADFKFAGDLVSALSAHPWIDLRIDLFEHNANPQPETSMEYVEWGDLFIAEFASRNAIWYSQHIRPHQQLIVHLHGYELLSDWIDELQVENVDAIVVASEFYRARALQMKDWPADKVRVIGNSVSGADLLRAKLPEARFHLGMAGYVPVLKRPDRALDLLARLRAEDSRYTLHLRGHSPWNYTWEWKKSAHQDSYRAFYRRIAEDPALRGGISIEPFGPDMGNWLRHIGWMLSTSTRETFHLAGIEGAASGAVPLVWEREGSREIFSDRWNFRDTDEVAEFVLRTNETAGHWAAEALRAVEHADSYDARTITSAWLEILADLATADTQQRRGSIELSDPIQARVFTSVEQTLEEEGVEKALEVLDQHISVTARSTGPLKDLELWVRGLSALDIQRFALFLPRSATWSSPAQRVVSARLLGSDSIFLGRHGLDAHAVDVVAPGIFRTAQADQQDFQVDRGNHVLQVDDAVRSDRWILTMASRLAAYVTDVGGEVLTVSGPWWLALTAAIAANRAGIRCVWQVSSADDVRRVERAFAARFGGDPADHLAFQAIIHMHGVLDPSGLLEGSHLLARLTVLDPDDVTSQLLNAGPGRPLHDYTGLEDSLVREASEVRSVVVGTEQLIEQLTSSGISITRGHLLADTRKALTPHIDLLIFDGELHDDSAWGRVLRNASPTAATAVSRLFDTARAVGITTVFVQSGSGPLRSDLYATARKADMIIAPDGSSDDLLTLNPVSVQQIIPLPATGASHFGPVQLRSLGLAVPPSSPTASAARSASGTGPDENHAAHAEAGSFDGDEQPDGTEPLTLDALEGISLVLATYCGRDRIRTMLDSIDQQTFPAELIEIIVVENGAQDGTENVVKDFARTTRASVRYMFREPPGAGGARNMGIQAASRPYLTFVDDDDELEPNFLMSMWSSAAANAVVLAALVDVHPDGTVETNTATNRRIAAFEGATLPVSRRPGTLGLNACKLIPTAIATTLTYPEQLHSGEDIVYMAGLLKQNLYLVPAAPVREASYRRHLRDNSISRRDLDFQFAVTERFEVIKELESIRSQMPDKPARAALDLLQNNQTGFIKRFLEGSPHRRNDAKQAAVNLGISDTRALSTLL